MERVVSDQQSAFKKGHSTETALIKVQNDILMYMDQQQVVPMAVLDLSATFDTCNHNIEFYLI